MNKTSKAGEYHIFSDIDNTSLVAFEIPKINEDAVARFIEEGGNFSLATGRSVGMTRDIARAFNANMPCIVLDGAAIYDFSEEKFVSYTELPDEAREWTKQIVAEFPSLCVSVSTKENSYDVGAVRTYKPSFCLDYQDRIDEITEKWLKVSLYLNAEAFAEIMDWIGKSNIDCLTALPSGLTCIGMIAKGCSKGTAIEWLRQNGYIASRKVAAIGDYDNDIDMLKVADISACPAGALDIVKEVAMHELGEAKDGALAQLVDFLLA